MDPRCIWLHFRWCGRGINQMFSIWQEGKSLLIHNFLQSYARVQNQRIFKLQGGISKLFFTGGKPHFAYMARGVKAYFILIFKIMLKGKVAKKHLNWWTRLLFEFCECFSIYALMKKCETLNARTTIKKTNILNEGIQII